jgi:Tfp pilus assembly protein PilX
LKIEGDGKQMMMKVMMMMMIMMVMMVMAKVKYIVLICYMYANLRDKQAKKDCQLATPSQF